MPTKSKQLNRKKYENLILFLLNEMGVLRGKKKLAKLLYFADFGAYEKNDAPITNERYFARPMGPLGINLAGIIAEMVASRQITTDENQDAAHLQPTVVYKPVVKPDLSLFTKPEIEVMKLVAKKYGALSGSELELISHAEAPYIGTEIDKQIPYELAIYRGADFAAEG